MDGIIVSDVSCSASTAVEKRLVGISFPMEGDASTWFIQFLDMTCFCCKVKADTAEFVRDASSIDEAIENFILTISNFFQADVPSI